MSILARGRVIRLQDKIIGLEDFLGSSADIKSSLEFTSCPAAY